MQRIEEVTLYLQDVDNLLEKEDYDDAIVRLQHAVELSPWSTVLREKRANLYERVGQYQSAISDIK